MLAFLKLLNPVDWLLVALIAGLIGFAGYEGVRIHHQRDLLAAAQAGQAKAEQALAELKAEYAAAAAKAEADARTEESRRTEAARKVISDAHAQVAEAEHAARDAADATERLRQRAAAIAASVRQAGGDPAAGGRGPSQQDSAALDMLASVLGRVGDDGGTVAAYADKLRIAGSACERQYDALTP